MRRTLSMNIFDKFSKAVQNSITPPLPMEKYVQPLSIIDINDFLSANDWPQGLQQYLIDNANNIPLRLFICDDSGSMLASDGVQIVRNIRNIAMQPCSRWAELGDTITFQSTIASLLNVNTEFKMLNKFSSLSTGGGHDENKLKKFHSVFSNESPSGGTPLCNSIRDAIKKVQSIEQDLRANRTRACIIIGTDGESSDGDFAEAMKPFERLPVSVVVKLCTNEDRIVDYWNEIDSNLEVDIDVLDDTGGEAEEVYKVNPWLNYIEPMHRIREFGMDVKELDLIDERLLSPSQMRFLCAILLGVTADELPPVSDMKGLVSRIEALVAEEHRYFSLYHKKPMPLVDINALKQCYKKSFF